jgi:hypothetical protein
MCGWKFFCSGGWYGGGGGHAWALIGTCRPGRSGPEPASGGPEPGTLFHPGSVPVSSWFFKAGTNPYSASLLPDPGTSYLVLARDLQLTQHAGPQDLLASAGKGSPVYSQALGPPS